MSRQRWGIFSSIDHLRPQAFVAEVLLYDRLVIPCPSDDTERSIWAKQGREPDRLDKYLEILGKRELVVQVRWTERLEQYRRRYQLAQDQEVTGQWMQALRMGEDPSYSTRLVLLKNLPPPDPGVAEVLPVAAYPSRTQFIEEFEPEERKEATSEDSKKVDSEQRRAHIEKLGWLLGHRFLVPAIKGKSDIELLKEAVKLACNDTFLEHRARLYKWQDDIVRGNIPYEMAIEEMQDCLNNYNALVNTAFGKVRVKFVWTAVIPGLLSLVPLALIPPTLPVAGLALGGVFINVLNFARFNRKPEIEPNQYDVAAMFHDAHKQFGWR